MASSNVLINNEKQLEFANFQNATFVGRYPGALVNGLLISVADITNFNTWPFRQNFKFKPSQAGQLSIAVVDSSGVLSGIGAQYQTFSIGVEVLTRPTTPVASTLSIGGVTVNYNTADTIPALLAAIQTAFMGSPTNAALYTVTQIKHSGGTGIIYFENKLFGSDLPVVTGDAYTNASVRIIQNGSYGSVIETYELLSQVAGSTKTDGSPAFAPTVINNLSKWIYLNPAANISIQDYTLAGGVDDYATTLLDGIMSFGNASASSINYLFGAQLPIEKKQLSATVENRRDCIGFVAPDLSDVVNVPGQEVANLKDFRNVRFDVDTTYTFTTDNWARVYDQWNNVYRWIPTDGGTAGLKARTDNLQNPWTSPAGYNRGVYQGYQALAWISEQGDRDQLYPLGVNSIVDFGAAGQILFGDKMTTQRPSAFSHVNVRSAFIVAEVAIANFAKYYFFENNNSDTQTSFLNAVNPFFRKMVSQGAFKKVISQADSNNNDAQVVQSNSFVGTFKIWPEYSINFIDLYFDAMGSSTAFTETEG